MLKALFVLKVFKFLSLFFGDIEKRLNKRAKLISKFMSSRHEKQTITIHLLPNISKCKGYQALKFGQLIE